MAGMELSFKYCPCQILGKKGKQIPQNPSVSFTLSTCRTNTILISSPKHSDKPTRSFYFEGREATAFGKKALKLIEIFTQNFPELNNYDLQILSENTFPHSSGIASSASSMSSLSLCLCDFIKSLRGDEFNDFYQVAVTMQDLAQAVLVALYMVRLYHGGK